VPAGRVDVYSFAGMAGDQIIARVNTRDDTGADTSLLHPVLTLLDAGMQPVASTTYRNGGCG